MEALFTAETASRTADTFERYWKLTKKTRAQGLQHWSRNFVFYLLRRLRDKTIPRGAITAERLSYMKANRGRGLRISELAKSIVAKRYGLSTDVRTRGNRLNTRGTKIGSGGFAARALLVKTELRLREAHRTFTQSSAKFPKTGDIRATAFAVRKADRLGQVAIREAEQLDAAEFDWGTLLGRWSATVAGVLKTKRAGVFNAALEDSRQNMLIYIARKVKEAGKAAARSV